MSKLFDVREIFQFAIQIEVNGEEFYRSQAKKVREKAVKSLFENLADDEIKHRKIFEGLAEKAGYFEPVETYPQEYFAYLRAYVDNIVFSKSKWQREVGRIKTAGAAVDFAIQRELDSILYYVEMKKFVAAEQHKPLEGIIAQERNHYWRLSELKKKM